MVTLSFIKPLDQPLGIRRLLEDLKNSLNDTRYSNFQIMVAFAKSGPLLRLTSYINKWRSDGKSASIILGIDHQGTSYEALDLALSLFDKVYVTHDSRITFHPKIYMFEGTDAARIFIGSNNLTPGGTELNFETAIDLNIDLPADSSILASVQSAWTDLLPPACPATTVLTPALLAHYQHQGLVIPERAMWMKGKSSGPGASGASGGSGSTRSRSITGLVIVPASPLPKSALTPITPPAPPPTSAPVSTIPPVPLPAPAPAPTSTTSGAATTAGSIPVKGLAIQICPQDNGEIYLSKLAVNQNPVFFNYPFAGLTIPKKAGNPAYPQRTPDPIVNINVIGASATPIISLPAYNLNTIYYTLKHEIRITAKPLVSLVPDYSILIMELSSTPGIDYEIIIHTPSSPAYASWKTVLNQQMPRGASPVARQFGWY